MARVVNQDVSPAPFLMDYPSKFTNIIIPWRLGLPSEALDAPKRRILDNGQRNGRSLYIDKLHLNDHYNDRLQGKKTTMVNKYLP